MNLVSSDRYGNIETEFGGILFNCDTIPDVKREEPKTINYTPIVNTNSSEGTNITAKMRFDGNSFGYDPDDISLEIGALTSEEINYIDVAFALC